MCFRFCAAAGGSPFAAAWTMVGVLLEQICGCVSICKAYRRSLPDGNLVRTMTGSGIKQPSNLKNR